MAETVEIKLFEGEPEELWPLLRLNTGMQQEESLRWFNEIEQGRGTLYFVAEQDGRRVGFIGLRLPRTHEAAGLEPPEVIDMAVVPECRRRGIGSALITRAVQETRRAGHHILWVFTDAHDTGNLAYYNANGFALRAIVPDGWGPGYPKAILRMELDK